MKKTIIDQFNLTGKKALVTGGAKGIGKSISIALAQAGADIAIIDLDINTAEDTVEEIKKIGVKSIAVKADVTVPNEVDNMANTVLQNFGTIDILFNNAGICINTKAEDMTYDEWMKVVNVNLNAVFFVAQSVGRIMIRNRNGSIINTASMSGHIVNEPQPQCAYNASKAAVIQLTKSLAAEWATHNIRVNSISPGYIATEMTKKAIQWIPQWEERTPLKRMGNPEELQGIVLYLASDASTYTTGSDFIIDGGFTCW